MEELGFKFRMAWLSANLQGCSQNSSGALTVFPADAPPPPPAEQIALCTVHKTYEEAPVLGPRPQCLGSPDPSFQLAVSPPRAVTGLDCQIAHVFSAHKFERYAWILNSQIVPQSTLFTYTYSFSAFYLSSNKRKCSNSVWTFFTLK